ncbi:hypothetical protein H920_11814 [Fukomys damarensis]|uniref:Uncharacterized protein n=1 Tax=Fukomys damarensis TaxID=885580 RepID=A0A091DVB3_FUKDA|nr:hypothetical protein H920_11814 [Fukomys damarensis]
MDNEREVGIDLAAFRGADGTWNMVGSLGVSDPTYSAEMEEDTYLKMPSSFQMAIIQEKHLLGEDFLEKAS